MSEHEHLCAECATVADCKQAFGKYWHDKSHGGVGCEHPFAYTRISDIVTGNPPPSPRKRTRQEKLT